MLIVGLTGGIASGKSTVSKIFSTHHSIPIIDADLIAREVIEPGTSGYSILVAHFGSNRILNEDGINVNRAALGDIIFHDESERKWLNNLIHPRVRKEIINRTFKYWLSGEWCVILDIPLLIEAGMWKWVGEIVVVFVNEKLQLSRLLSREIPGPPLTEVQANARISSQMSLKEKINYSTYVLDNSGSIIDLNNQIDKLVFKWKKEQGFSNPILKGWWFKLCWLIPPIGLSAGLMVLITRWIKFNKLNRKKQSGEGGRRKGRGELERNTKPWTGENIELREFNGRPGGRRRTGGGEGSSSILDQD